MEYKNPYIKVTWPDTASAFTKESVRRVKEYFKEKYNTRHVIINTKVISNKSDTKLKSLEISESILDLTYQNKLLKEYVKQSLDYEEKTGKGKVRDLKSAWDCGDAEREDQKQRRAKIAELSLRLDAKSKEIAIKIEDTMKPITAIDADKGLQEKANDLK